MPRVILLLAIAITLYLLLKRVRRMPPHRRRSGYIQLLLGVTAIAAIILTVAGKMHWVGAALTGLLVVFRQTLPLLIRAFPLLQQWWQRGQGTGVHGQQSEVSSDILRMHLDHSSGELSGQVLKGPYKDWYLKEMNHQQLSALLQFCRQEDEDSVQLLRSYLDQRFPEGFETHDEADHSSPASDGAGLTRREALAVLGLNDDASHDDIIAAHRRLIQKLHPDRGGNDYLAAKINEAKDILLKDLTDD